MRDESCQPSFGIFIETLEQCDSQCVFDSDITGRVIHQFVSGLDISLRINFVQFVLRSKLVAAAFHFHRVDETGDRNELCLLSVGELAKRQGKTLHYRAMGEVGILDKAIGQFRVNADLDLNFRLWKDTVSFIARGSISNTLPAFYMLSLIHI